MKDRLKTLLIYATGGSVRSWVRETLWGERGRNHHLPTPLRWLDRMLLKDSYASLSYVNDWLESFSEYPGLETDKCNINNLAEFFRLGKKIPRYELIVVLHSAAGDKMSLLLAGRKYFLSRRGKLLVLFGNEYLLMPEKLKFLQETAAEFVGSQLPEAAARWLYADCPRTRVLLAPHGLNPRRYHPRCGLSRTVDIGFVGFLYPMFIGDQERTNLIRYFQQHGHDHGFSREIILGKLPAPVWAQKLSSFRGTIGAEAGTYYLERDDRTISNVKRFLRRHPDASFTEVYQGFFAGRAPVVSGKAISSRHFEAAGTKTCQILISGHYNGILQESEHFIPVRKDLSNVREVIAQFGDETFRQEMVKRAYEYVMEQHTYTHRVAALVEAVSR